jgi:hypothetical protein
MGCGSSREAHERSPSGGGGGPSVEAASVDSTSEVQAMTTAVDTQPRRPPPPVPTFAGVSLQQQQVGVERATPSWLELAEADDDEDVSLSSLRKHVPLPTDWTPPARHGGRGPPQGAADAPVDTAVSALLPVDHASADDVEAPQARASMTVQPRVSASSAAGAVVRVRLSSSDALVPRPKRAPPPAPVQPLPDAGRVSDTVQAALEAPAQPAGSDRAAAAVFAPPPAAPAAVAASVTAAAALRPSAAPRGSSSGEGAAPPDGGDFASTAQRRVHDAATSGMSHARLIAALKRSSHAGGDAANTARMSHSNATHAGEHAAAAAADTASLAAQVAQHATIAALRQSRLVARRARVSRSLAASLDTEPAGDDGIAAPSPRDAPPSPSLALSSRAAPPPIGGGDERRISGTTALRSDGLLPPARGALVTRSMDGMVAHAEQQRVPRASVPAAPYGSGIGARPRLDPSRAITPPYAPPPPPAAPAATSALPRNSGGPPAFPSADVAMGSKAGEEGPVWSPSVPQASVATRQKLSALRKSLHSHHPSQGGTSPSSKAGGDAGWDAPSHSPMKPAAAPRAEPPAPPLPAPAPAPAPAPPPPPARVLSEAALSQAATEVELVFRLGSLATDGDVADAVAAASRLRHLLSTVAHVARAIGAEPQNVFAYLVTHMHCLTAASLRSSLERQAAVPAANGRTRMSVTHTGPPPVWPDADAVLGGQEGATQLCSSVAELRRLVRIKVQDNNDLALANRCVNDACSFFDSLAAFACAQGLSPSQAMAHLRATP